MTSELRVDNLKGSTTGGSINVLGEGTSATTNLQQGLGKCWCHFDGTAGSVSFADSFNMSGITDNGTGNFSVAFANNMGNATYASAIACTFFNTISGPNDPVTTTTGSIRILTITQDTSSQDRTETSYLNLGDLA